MTSERNFDDIYFKLSTRIICSTENYTLRLTVEKRFKTRKSNISNNREDTTHHPSGVKL